MAEAVSVVVIAACSAVAALAMAAMETNERCIIFRLAEVIN